MDDLLDKIVWDSCDNAESCSPSSVLCGMIRSDFGMREYFCDKRRNLLCKHVSFFARSYQLRLANTILRVALKCIPRRIQKFLCDGSMHVQRYDISGVQLLEDA